MRDIITIFLMFLLLSIIIEPQKLGKIAGDIQTSYRQAVGQCGPAI